MTIGEGMTPSVRVDVRSQGVVTFEGAIVSVSLHSRELRGALGPLVSARGRLGTFSLARDVPPGDYDLTSELRECGGSCRNLAPVSARCTTRIRVERSRRTVVTLRYSSTSRCSASLTTST